MASWRKRNPEKSKALRNRGARLPSARFSAAKHQAKCRGRRWELTREQFAELSEQSCHYCGLPFARVTGSGLDQKVPGAGYTLDNVVPCCSQCNRAKSDFFTTGEMETVIGPAIRQVMLCREQTTTSISGG